MMACCAHCRQAMSSCMAMFATNNQIVHRVPLNEASKRFQCSMCYCLKKKKKESTVKNLFDPALSNKILKPIYGAKEKAVCLHCVHWYLQQTGHCWSFGHKLLTCQLSTWRHGTETCRFLEWTAQSKPYVHHVLLHLLSDKQRLT